ncbi:carbohydrate kinase [Parasedimentitalea marina]|uniref:Carbohydrate kinase n=1 Tax=Parasedimentitalea marina TaxID=2483033 RepID=A0A3T0MYY4_9RHOB|nr:FGGY-family carbohydrate kinase [Parasedimentitalea marina]AZV76975.1 carbohydrate kinase [Parasedimentitalea marina]
MTVFRHIAVIDIGKTNVKLALVDLVTMKEIAVDTRPNAVLPGPPWPHFDVDTHWVFLLDALKQFHRDHGVDAISVTTHGASVALLDKNGELAAPILDYECTGPAETAAQYDVIRPPFEQTGSPRLGGGLNVGAQLHWQFQADPGLHARTAHILTYPQYWGYRLTGVAASDVTSIGCHTDLWQPHKGEFSDLVEVLDIADKIAPVRKSTDILGTVLPEIANATGLNRGTPVVCGIHDSNASLYPHIVNQKPPFSVVSTGTWVVVMAMGGAELVLDPSRDTLVNVNALGEAVASARFMGGREFETVQKGRRVSVEYVDVEQVLKQEIMLLPAVDPLSGPYQGKEMRWHGDCPSEGSGSRAVALAYYLAMMTDTCLRLTGADGPIIVEGPFAHNAQYLAMLQAATGRPVLQRQSSTGTSIGAALLFGSDIVASKSKVIDAPENFLQMEAYAVQWRLKVERDLA